MYYYLIIVLFRIGTTVNLLLPHPEFACDKERRIQITNHYGEVLPTDDIFKDIFFTYQKILWANREEGAAHFLYKTKKLIVLFLF